jgi:protein-S-isoprenylcysteine O-methyltransferase Ste14
MKVIIKKFMLFLLLTLIYQTVIFVIFVPQVYSNTAYMIYLLMSYTITLADTLVRPWTQEQNLSNKFEIIMLLVFILTPFFLIAAYFENVFLIAPLISFWNSIIVAYIGFVIYLAAGIMVLIARTQLGRFGSGELITAEDHQLYTEGVYHYIRNPMYSGALIGVVGFCFIFRSLITMLVLVSFYFLVFRMRINREERILLEKFGDEFVKYKNSTKKLIPFVY